MFVFCVAHQAYYEKLPHRGVGGVAQPTILVVASNSSACSLDKGIEMPTGCARKARGAASSSGGQN